VVVALRVLTRQANVLVHAAHADQHEGGRGGKADTGWIASTPNRRLPDPHALERDDVLEAQLPGTMQLHQLAVHADGGRACWQPCVDTVTTAKKGAEEWGGMCDWVVSGRRAGVLGGARSMPESKRKEGAAGWFDCTTR